MSPPPSLGSPDGPENVPPVGVFWDIENCCVPTGRSAAAVVQRMRARFFQGHREAEFMCVCDISKENKAVIQELNNCQVCVCTQMSWELSSSSIRFSCTTIIPSFFVISFYLQP